MREKLLIFIVLTCFSSFVHRQPDCSIFYTYVGKIKSQTKFKQILLPTTPFLVGYETQDKERAFYKSSLKENKISDTLISHLSSDFCMELEDIINHVFKKNKTQYLIKLLDNSPNGAKNKIREVYIPIEAINFTSTGKGLERIITINLGEIKL